MSTRFIDGPAEGKRLSLQRDPLFLRVVVDGRGKVDALDLLDDVADPSERIFVYRQFANHGRAFFCTRGKGCQLENMNSYTLYHEQPADEVLRDNAKWAEWCQQQATEK